MPRFGAYEACLVHRREGESSKRGEILDEHGMKVDGNEVSVWVESEAGKEFDLRWGVFETSVSSRAKVFVNGVYTTSRFHRPESGFGWHTPLAFRNENGSFRRYTFAPLPDASEVENAVPGSCDRVCTIQIEVEHVLVHRKDRSPQNSRSQTQAAPREPHPALTTMIPVNGASRQSVQHIIALGKEHIGQPMPSRRGEYMYSCEPFSAEPITIFTFFCRPRCVLLDLRVMPDPALKETIEGIGRCKRRIKEIKSERNDTEHQLEMLQDRKKRLKKDRTAEIAAAIHSPVGSAHNPIDLADSRLPSGLSLRDPIDLTEE